MEKGIFHALSPLLEPGMGRKMRQQFPTSSSTSRLSKVLFLLLEKGKWRDRLWIIGGLCLKSQIIPVGQEMKLGMIQCGEDEEIRARFHSSAGPSGSRKGLEVILIHKENPDSGG